MTQKEKQLFIRDICARLPYGVKLRYVEDLVVKKESHIITLNNIYLEHILNGDADIKPYLRPISSMTEEEAFRYNHLDLLDYSNDGFEMPNFRGIDWLLANHFDFRGLIPMGLALEAKEGMYED